MQPYEDSLNDETFEKKVEAFLRNTGRLFPVTERQVEAFEQQGLHEEIPPSCNNPEAILAHGFTTPVLLQYRYPETGMNDNSISAAARNGSGMSLEIRKKMDDNRQKSSE
jgi:hypothetical protein